WIKEAEIHVLISSHVVRTQLPFPHADLYLSAYSGSSIKFCQALAGSFSSLRASDHKDNTEERIYGYLTRCGLYVYQEKEAPLGQPRGSYSGMPGPVEG